MTYAQIQHQRELKARRIVQDMRDAERHRQFDLQAQDNHMKYDRPQFAVVGEGSHAAQENYRRGWERIFGHAD